MSDTPVYRPGQFVWREIMTPNVEDTLRFYGEVIGWKHETHSMGNGESYTMLKVGETPVGGCMKLPASNIPPHWALYVSVDDVDATAALATKNGGKIFFGPDNAGEFGRFASLADPQGAAISIWKGNKGDGPRGENDRPGLGEFCWEQLNTSDPKNAHPFYAALFGWTDAPFSGGGGMDVWSAGKTQVASRMQAPPGAPPHWLTYVVVDTLDAANKRVTKQGGKILMERIDVPTIGSISVVQDNVGAVIGLFQTPRS
jgi:predicted enzyme related to lactoylglutathione lyase